MHKYLVFEIWGNYGHFRKFYTTSSPLTHAFPPKTAIWGMIGAIIGLDKDSYLTFFQNPEIMCGVKIISPIIKTRIAVNLIDTKASKFFFADTSQHTQISIELLKRPRYRIYFSHFDSDLYSRVKENLENHRTHYTLCLGLSEYLAQFDYLGEYKANMIQDLNEVRIDSIIPTDRVLSNSLEDGYEYFKETVPSGMNPQRQPTGYQEVLYERNGRSILCKTEQYYRLESGDNVIFL